MSEQRPLHDFLRVLSISVIVGASAAVGSLLAHWGIAFWFLWAAVIACLMVYLFIRLFLTSAAWLSGGYAKSDPLSPQRLTSFASEFQAEALVEALAAEDIRAMAVGGYTAGFRAEAPGEVQVVVAGQDLPRAMEVLEKFEADAEPTAPFEQGMREAEE